MTEYSQTDRLLQFHTPLGPDKLILLGMTGTEGISQLFNYNLNLASQDSAINFADIIGKRATVSLRLENDEVRYLSGIISSFTQRDADEHFTYYQAELVPWLWFLTRASDCRIFQEKTIPEVIEQVFKEAGFTDFELDLGSYDTWEYCVQYRETHFNFVSRLMEHYGMQYFFKHEKNRHILVIADKSTANAPCPSQTSATFEPMQVTNAGTDIVRSWEVERRLQPGKYSLTDFDFKKPKTSLRSDTPTTFTVGNNSALEMYDYPGEHDSKVLGDRLATLRMEEAESLYQIYTGTTTCRAFQAGFRFRLFGHETRDFNQEYLITTVSHSAVLPGLRSAQAGEVHYSNTITCIPFNTAFRPRRVSRKPVIQGIQTALVVGPSGEEIYTDKYGRVKVQFHWDRQGRYDENSSCWIRVAQIWAGKKWGSVFLPRIGQEVVVSFLEGDPDQPLIIGSVFNDETMPPYSLPAEMTKSTFKSQTSKGGGGFNEIRMEDKKGSEQLFLHAQKDMDVRVKNDRREWMGRDQNLIVTRDKKAMVERDSHLAVRRDKVERVYRDHHLEVRGKQAIKIAGSHSLSVTSDVNEQFKANHSEQVTGTYYLKGMNVIIEALTGLTIKVGGNFLTINAAGIQMKGAMVMINSGGAALSGQPGQLVPPLSPEEPEIADNAEPGSKDPSYKQQRAQASPFKLAAFNAPSHRASAAGGATNTRAGRGEIEDEAQKTHWIEIELMSEDGKPVAGEKYQITLPDGSTVDAGITDEKGRARVTGIDPGQCHVTFPNLDKHAWAPAQAGTPQTSPHRKEP